MNDHGGKFIAVMIFILLVLPFVFGGITGAVQLILLFTNTLFGTP